MDAARALAAGAAVGRRQGWASKQGLLEISSKNAKESKLKRYRLHACRTLGAETHRKGTRRALRYRSKTFIIGVTSSISKNLSYLRYRVKSSISKFVDLKFDINILSSISTFLKNLRDNIHNFDIEVCKTN